MRRWCKWLCVLASVLLVLPGCLLTDKKRFKPPPIPDELRPPPVDDPRYNQPMRYPKETLNQGRYLRGDVDLSPTPQSAPSPRVPGARTPGVN